MSRMSRMQHAERHVPVRKPKKITRKEAESLLNTLFKRQAVARGLIDPTKGKFRFQWHYDGGSGEVQANTRGEARGLVKKALGIPKGERLPIGVALFMVGVTEGRDVPLVAVIGKNQ